MEQRVLAPCSAEAVALIKQHSSGLVEIGAGEGVWARTLREAGVPVEAFDINPRGEGVTHGDHLAAAKYDGDLLAVWPPDGTSVAHWIAAKPWPRLILCGCRARWDWDGNGYRLAESLQIESGWKGRNLLNVYYRA